MKLFLLLFLSSFVSFTAANVRSTTAKINSTAANVTRYCYYKERNPCHNYSVYTPFLATSNYNPIKYPKGCVPHFLWSYIRHGTRFASRAQFERMKKMENLTYHAVIAHEAGRGQLHEKDVQRLNLWQYIITLGRKEIFVELALQGMEDMKHLGLFFNKSFPKLINTGKPAEMFIYQSSDAQRAYESTIHIANAYTNQTAWYTTTHNITENKLIRLHKFCPNFQKGQRTEEMQREVKLFALTSHINKTIIDISERLGFTHVLTYDEVEILYETCALEGSWKVEEKTPTCACFRQEDFKVFEYKMDLEWYWRYGYGNPLTKKLGCPLLRDMLVKLSDAAKPNKTHHAAFLVGHIQMLLPLIVNLGLNRDDEPLRHDNYEKMKENRKWRLSRIGGWASYILAVLYSCPSYKDGQYQVVLYQNGREVIIPKCGKSPCPLEELKKQFHEVFDEKNCNTDFC